MDTKVKRDMISKTKIHECGLSQWASSQGLSEEWEDNECNTIANVLTSFP